MELESIQKIRQIKSRHEQQWMTLSAVQAVGIGMLKNGREGIIISVDKFETSLVDNFPAEIDGVQIEIVESGTFKAL